MRVLILRALFVLGILTVLVAPFAVKVRVACMSQAGSCPDGISVKLAKFNGLNSVSAKRGITKVLTNDYLVSNYFIQFKLPNILDVNIVVKKPKFAIFSKETGKYFLVENNGLVIGVSDTNNLPVIEVSNNNFEFGKKISDELYFSLKIVEGVKAMYAIDRGVVTDNSLAVDMPHAIKVIFPMKDADVEVLLGSLRIIYTKITTEDQGKYTTIDLRYVNPVLR